MIDCVDFYNEKCNSLTHTCADCPDRIPEHVYSPNYQAMGDCRVCGHDADNPWHIFGRRAIMFGEYCKCEKPLIKCDNNGVRCVACGLPKAHELEPQLKKLPDAPVKYCEKCGKETQHIGDGCLVCNHILTVTTPFDKPLEEAKSMKKSLTFDDLRFANVQRNQEWDPDNKISGAFRGLEFSGEVGEFIEAVQDQLVNLAIKTGTICNMTKKMERERLGLKGSRVSLIEIAKEFADAQITLDLLAMHFSIDIALAVKMVFNAKSDEHGFKTHIGEDSTSGMPNVMTDDDDFPEQVDDPSLPESESFHGI